MKLLRYGPAGQEKAGLLDPDGNIRDLSDHLPDLGGTGVSVETLNRIATIDASTLHLVDDPGRIGACLSHVPNFFAVGLNYAQHAAEIGVEPPAEPILFSKATSCLAGPNDPIVLPKGSEKTDWECELGIVMGKTAYDVSEADAMGCIAGFCIVNDISERSFQLERGGQWIKGKSAPGFGPIGPWLVTPDEVADVQNLSLSLKLNGEVKQSSSTSDMIFSVVEIVSYISRFMELRPGDLIATGTPSGVGMGLSPPRFMQPGDLVELAIDGLGTQRQDVQARG